MPDGDRITRRIRYEWARAYEGVMGLAAPADVARQIVKASAAQLRRGGGLPMLPEAERLVTAVRNGDLSKCDALARARGLGGSSSSGMAAARAVSRCLVEPPTDVDPRHAIATVMLEELLNSHLLDKVVPLLVDEARITADDAAAYVESCRAAASADLVRLAGQVANEPAGGRYRAPAHHRRTRVTSELLGESIE